MAGSFIEAQRMSVVSAEDGHCTMIMPVTSEQCNPYGMIHGGVLYSLADTAAGYAVYSLHQESLTVEGNVSYLRAGKNTDTIRAEASIIKDGARIVVVRASVYDDSGKELITARFTYYVLDKQKGS